MAHTCLNTLNVQHASVSAAQLSGRRAVLCRVTPCSSSSRTPLAAVPTCTPEQQQPQQPLCTPQQALQHHQHALPSPQQPSAPHSSVPTAAVAAALLAAAAAAHPGTAAAAAAAAGALCIHAEPSNALSLPTWAIHVSSVTEWVAAMALFWKYAEVTGNQRWKGMTFGMMPSLGSAMAACTWHFFYNSPDLDFLVALQAFLTVVGNCTCWYAAWRIYDAAQAEKAASS